MKGSWVTHGPDSTMTEPTLCVFSSTSLHSPDSSTFFPRKFSNSKTASCKMGNVGDVSHLNPHISSLHIYIFTFTHLALIYRKRLTSTSCVRSTEKLLFIPYMWLHSLLGPSVQAAGRVFLAVLSFSLYKDNNYWILDCFVSWNTQKTQRNVVPAAERRGNKERERLVGENSNFFLPGWIVFQCTM